LGGGGVLFRRVFARGGRAPAVLVARRATHGAEGHASSVVGHGHRPGARAPSTCRWGHAMIERRYATVKQEAGHK